MFYKKILLNLNKRKIWQIKKINKKNSNFSYLPNDTKFYSFSKKLHCMNKSNFSCYKRFCKEENGYYLATTLKLYKKIKKIQIQFFAHQTEKIISPVTNLEKPTKCLHITHPNYYYPIKQSHKTEILFPLKITKPISWNSQQKIDWKIDCIEKLKINLKKKILVHLQYYLFLRKFRQNGGKIFNFVWPKNQTIYRKNKSKLNLLSKNV